jgi:hypothetical protein
MNPEKFLLSRTTLSRSKAETIFQTFEKKGKERMKVFVKNISARQATQTLTLTLSIIGPNSSSFSFVKGNQETFDPIAPGGESSGEKIVIKTSKSNSGGTIVMEVREGGKLLGVLKQNF